MTTPTPPTILRGTYQLLDRLGASGMGEVYVAAHARLHKRFALLFARFQLRDDRIHRGISRSSSHLRRNELNG